VVASTIAIVVLMVVKVVLKSSRVEFGFGFGFVHRRIVYLETEIETDFNRKKERMK